VTRRTLVSQSLRWYWRTNAAVVAGVAVAVSVLAGSLLVGDSVRASLRRIAVERLGNTDAAILGTGFFREQFAADVRGAAGGAIADAAPLIAIEGIVASAASGRRAAGVQVFGVDERFWRFHGAGALAGPEGREAYLSAALAAEIGAGEGDGLLVRVRRASDIPASALQGRRDDLGRSFRVTHARTLSAGELGEFSLSTGQGLVRSVFVPLDRLQGELQKEDQANVALLAFERESEPPEAVDDAVARAATLDDLGLTVKPIEGQHALSVEGRTGFIDAAWQQAIERASREIGVRSLPILTYIANTIRIGDREIPYSVVTGMDFGLPDVPAGSAPGVPAAGRPPLWLNEWAARELAASVGDAVTLDYLRWSDEEGLATGRTAFTLAGVVPMIGAGGDRTLTPEYPGLTDAAQIGDWDPPFPVDLARIQPRDERYWDQYRAAPKAFVTYREAQRLWASRFGDATSVRLFVPAGRPLDEVRGSLESALTGPGAPLRAGLNAHPVRERALAAARGATDFGEYFFYFSFFLFVSGLILAVLFFKLGIEQRAPQIGLLQAMGFTPRDIRALFLAEGSVLAAAGTVLGVPGAVAFCALILAGLRTWWIDAVGTAAIGLDVRASSLAIGAAAGLAAAVVTTVLSLRALRGTTARTLIAGGPVASPAPEARQRLAGITYQTWVWLSAGSAVVLIALAALEAVPPAAAFFGAGGLLLIACLLIFSAALRRPVRTTIRQPGLAAVLRLGARQTRWRPARSVLVAALVAAATFVIVAVGAFRRDAAIDARAPQSATGGFPLFAESVIPVMHDLSTVEGRDELGLGQGEPLLEEVSIARFRLRPGDEGSCLNLYRPASPRILAPPEAFVREGRFEFAAVMAGSDAERANPWLLLDRTFEDGAVPVIGDATSLTYVLHAGVGDDLVIPGEDGAPLVLRVVAALSHSMLQSELLISERHFVRLFPRREGYRFFLIDAPPDRQAEVTALLEDRLADAGFDVQSSVERLRAYERVERTYLSTFQTLGGLGLVIGTLGLGAVLLRNVLERRRELALLRAVGYRSAHVRGLVLAESLLLLGAGVGAGVTSAVLAVAPAWWSRGGGGPGWTDTAVLLVVVVVAGVSSSLVAARAAMTAAPVSALRSE